jgi:hypothetical protein
MQAVVKTPRIEISIRGAAIPPRLMDVLKKNTAKSLDLLRITKMSLSMSLKRRGIRVSRAR